MKKLLFIILILAYFHPSFSQDTIMKYYNKAWQECNKDTAYYYTQIFQQDGLYVMREFSVKGDIPYREGSYYDTAFRIKQGTFKWYRENGTLWHISPHNFLQSPSKSCQFSGLRSCFFISYYCSQDYHKRRTVFL